MTTFFMISDYGFAILKAVSYTHLIDSVLFSDVSIVM